MKYYVVSAKCGHVGRNNYIIKKFYVKAETGENAAQIVKDKPRVKHTRRDAIQAVIEINEEQYLQGLKEIRDDMYFKPFSITMYAYECKLIKGDLELTEHTEKRWVKKEDLKKLKFANADLPIIDLIK